MVSSPRKPQRGARKAPAEIHVPPQHDWRTSDEDEINRRRVRAQEEQPRIRNLDPAHAIFSDFEVQSASGLSYRVEIRDLAQRQFSCGCVDFRVNGLGTCKHIEAVLAHVEARFSKAFWRAQKSGSERIDVVADPLSDTLRVERGLPRLSAKLRAFFKEDGRLKNGAPDETVAHLRAAGVAGLRLSQEIAPWLETRRCSRRCTSSTPPKRSRTVFSLPPPRPMRRWNRGISGGWTRLPYFESFSRMTPPIPRRCWRSSRASASVPARCRESAPRAAAESGGVKLT